MSGPLRAFFSPDLSDSPALGFCLNVTFLGVLFKREFCILPTLSDCFSPCSLPPNYYIMYVNISSTVCLLPRQCRYNANKNFCLVGYTHCCLPRGLTRTEHTAEAHYTSENHEKGPSAGRGGQRSGMQRAHGFPGAGKAAPLVHGLLCLCHHFFLVMCSKS